ncbi:MAG: hypothetical protein G01um10147_692 [Microgenomates group bacterium Gr01-1014_7]|nr:MAG: hypothetical protein G01um10147_692 [Microgenomates group bacterium Gr01-1014_7]
MKLISLNTWGGKIYQPLMNFIKQESQDTDIFCFQEVFKTTTKNQKYKGFRINLYNEISAFLKDFHGYFAPTQDNYVFASEFSDLLDFDISWGLALFVKKSFIVKSSGDFFVFGKRNSFVKGNLTTVPRNIQYINLEVDSKKLLVCNVHGIWIKGSKKDSPSRIEQSKRIKAFLTTQEGKKVICGDFNLDITTESIKILERESKNLIREFNIERTRSRLSPFFRKDDFQKFADYTFVSPDVLVKNFEVPDIQISDHLPMILEFS